jgi:AcrR family transcriptional regulator
MEENAKNQELAAALKEALKAKPLNRITVTEISQACHINRQSFYYHFKDVYYLAEYMYKTDVSQMLKEIGPANWEEAFSNVFMYALSNRVMVLNTISAVDRDILQYNLGEEVGVIIGAIIKERENALGITLLPEDEKVLAGFYMWPITGIVLDWMKSGMTTDPKAKFTSYVAIMNSNLEKNIRDMSAQEKNEKK